MCATPANAASLASDDASNYNDAVGSPNPWVTGSNGGSGFGAWDLSNNNNDSNTHFAGYFLGDSTAGTGDINTGGQSFAIYANPNGAFATAVRTHSWAICFR